MKGETTLVELPFRYGGIRHDYDSDVEEWIAQTDALKGEMRRRGMPNRNPYRKCFACGGKMRNPRGAGGTLLKKSYPYCAEYKRRDGKFYFAILCRGCAYLYGRGVVEMDGKTYQNPWEFREEQYKKELRNERETDPVQYRYGTGDPGRTEDTDPAACDTKIP